MKRTLTRGLALAVSAMALGLSGVVLGPAPTANAALNCDSPSGIANGYFTHNCWGNKKPRRVTYTRKCWIGGNGSYSTKIPASGSFGVCMRHKAPSCTLGSGMSYVTYKIG